MVTFRPADSLPRSVLDRWELELAHLVSTKMEVERRRRIENHLDKGVGMAWMKDCRIARLVQNALLYFDGSRYQLPAWVVMPNHVHVLVVPQSGFSLADIVHSWKSFTSNEANKLLGQTGQFWQEEYFDRYIRNAGHYADAIDYIENNPVKARLCSHREGWEFSSARLQMPSPSDKCGQDARAPGK